MIIYVYSYVQNCIQNEVWIQLFMCTPHMFVHTSISLFNTTICVYMYTTVCIHTHICVQTYICEYTHIHIQTYTYFYLDI